MRTGVSNANKNSIYSSMFLNNLSEQLTFQILSKIFAENMLSVGGLVSVQSKPSTLLPALGSGVETHLTVDEKVAIGI